MLRIPLQTVLLAWSWVVMAGPQNIGADIKVDVQPPSVQEQLAQHGIGKDKQSLLGALRNSDPEVRILAALRLGAYDVAAMRSDALPALVEALQAESAPLPAAAMATTLGMLGDPRGVAVLERMCFDPGIGPRIKLQVARDLLVLKSEKCVDPILALVFRQDDKNEEWATLDGVIGLLPELQRFHYLTANQNERIVEIARRGLAASNSGTRIFAAWVRGRMIDASAAADLLNAIALERDPGVRDGMTTALDALQQRPYDQLK